MKKTTKIFAFCSAISFLIGSVYYSYIQIMSAYLSMHEIKLIDSSYEFSLLKINSRAILSVFVVLLMCTMAVILIVVVRKNKYAVLSLIFPIVIMLIQCIMQQLTILNEFMFAKYVLHLSHDFDYYIGKIIKYVPFAIAAITGVVYLYLDQVNNSPRGASFTPEE